MSKTMTKNNNINTKIGIFDSGFGGLTIFKEIKKLLPDYDYVYLGDNARTPYGNRSFDTVLKFTKEGVDYLFSKGCRLIIIACNTASARALRSIQQQWLTSKYKDHPDYRVLGVIRPTVEKVSSHTKTSSVALWATSGTVNSDSFVLEIAHFAPSVKLVQNACPLLAPLVEAGELSGEGTKYFIKKYWQETKAKTGANNIDTLLLACTHYPLLLPLIKEVLPENIKILNQGELVSFSLKDYLDRHPEMERKLSRGKTTSYFTTDRCDYFDHLAQIFMGEMGDKCTISSELAIM